MGRIIPPQPVKLFVGLLYEDEEIQKKALEQLSAHYREPDFESSEVAFTCTEYYREIGDNLKRKFVSFSSLIACDDLPRIKIETNTIEEVLKNKENNRRCINIDPGYLAAEKVVLATTKNYSHRPSLGNGIYAELTYIYINGAYREVAWTYPDYRTDAQKEIFTHMRKIYMQQIRQGQWITR